MSDLVDFVEWINNKKETMPLQFTLKLLTEIALFLNEPAPDREILESKIVTVESDNMIVMLAAVKKE